MRPRDGCRSLFSDGMHPRARPRAIARNRPLAGGVAGVRAGGAALPGAGRLVPVPGARPPGRRAGALRGPPLRTGGLRTGPGVAPAVVHALEDQLGRTLLLVLHRGDGGAPESSLAARPSALAFAGRGARVERIPASAPGAVRRRVRDRRRPRRSRRLRCRLATFRLAVTGHAQDAGSVRRHRARWRHAPAGAGESARRRGSDLRDRVLDQPGGAGAARGPPAIAAVSDDDSLPAIARCQGRAAGAQARPPTVAVLGGGRGGLACAHELAREGGRVTIYEASDALGGKARSQYVPGTGTEGRQDWPGEHGFRFYPAFYRHVIASLREIHDRESPTGTVAGNLVPAPTAGVALAGRGVITTPRKPRSVADLRQAVAGIREVGGSAGELARYLAEHLKYLPSCDARRGGEGEALAWAG